MKKTGRILALILAMLMVLSVMPAVSASGTFTDVDSSTSKGIAIDKLASLRILEGYGDGTFRPNNTITRAEFCAVITRFLNQTDFLTQNAMSGFSDLDADDSAAWARPYVKKAAELKIVNGFEDGTFRASQPVTYEQAVKMIVCALGYGVVAQEEGIEGDWSSGYITRAGTLGILKNATVSDKTQGADRGMVSLLVYNALTVDKMVKNGDGYEVEKGSSVLTQNQKREEISGVVTAIGRTALTNGKSTVDNDMVEIDGEKVYKTNGINVNSLLGKYVTGYAQETSDGDEKELVSLAEKPNANSVIKIDAGDVISSTSSSVEYYASKNSDRASTVNVGNADVIYNGKALPGYDMADLKDDLKCGYVEFISNGGDKNPEVINIVSYKIVVVSSITNDSKTGTTRVLPNSTYSSETVTIPAADDRNYIFSISGAASKASSIQKWDILTIMESDEASAGKKVFDVTVSRNAKTGKISRISTGNDGNPIIRLGTSTTDYSFAYSYLDLPDSKKPEISLDQTITIYLDSQNQIAAVNVAEAQANSTTAYLIDLQEEKELGKSDVKIWVYAATSSNSGAERTLTLAKKVTVDGTSYSVSDVPDVLLASAQEMKNTDEFFKNATTYPYHQLIRYTTNSSGLVDSIDTVVKTSKESTDSLIRGVEYTGSKCTYNSTARTFKQGNTTKFVVANNTRIITVPENLGDIKKYSVRSYSAAFANGQGYSVEAFDLSTTSVASYVLKYGKDAVNINFTYSTPYMIVKEVNTELDAEGEPTVVITGWNSSGNEVRITLDEELGGDASEFVKEPSEINNGDVIRYMSDNGKVVQIKKAYEAGTVPPETTGGGKNGTRFFATDSADESCSAGATRYRAVFGTILAYDSETSTIKLTRTLTSDEGGIKTESFDTYSKANNAIVFIYDSSDSSTDKVEVNASIDNITAYEDVEESPDDASRVFMISGSSGTWRIIYIIK